MAVFAGAARLLVAGFLLVAFGTEPLSQTRGRTPPSLVISSMTGGDLFRFYGGLMRGPRLEHAIGVLYLSETERGNYYFHAPLADRFDYVLHFDEARAVESLERSARWEAGARVETFPRVVGAEVRYDRQGSETARPECARLGAEPGCH